MTTPRDGSERPEDQRGWTEPEHLGGSSAQRPDTPGGTPEGTPEETRGGTPGDSAAGDARSEGWAPQSWAPTSWEPPGWSLPPAQPERPSQPAGQQPAGQQPAGQQGPDTPSGPEQDWEATPPPAPWYSPRDQHQGQHWDQQGDPAVDRYREDEQPGVDQAGPGRPGAEEPRRGGLFGGLFGGGRNRPPRKPTPLQEVFAPKGGTGGDTLSWGLAHGWTPSDGTGPEDAAIAALTRSSPVRPAKSEVPSNVLRGREAGLDLVAFDIVSPVGQAWVPTHAITAAPVLGEVPGFRLGPARFWRHGTGGLLHIPSGDPEFDDRWVLLAPEDGPRLRRLVDDPVVRQVLLGSDDGDELWAAEGFVAAVRPDGNRPLLIQHHARILAAVTAALAGSS